MVLIRAKSIACKTRRIYNDSFCLQEILFFLEIKDFMITGRAISCTQTSEMRPTHLVSFSSRRKASDNVRNRSCLLKLLDLCSAMNPGLEQELDLETGLTTRPLTILFSAVSAKSGGAAVYITTLARSLA